MLSLFLGLCGHAGAMVSSLELSCEKNDTIRAKPGFPLSYWAVPVRMRGLDRVVAMRGHHHPYDQPVFWTRSIYDCLDLCLDHLSSTWILLLFPPSCVCMTFGFVCWFATTTSATFIC